MSILRSCFICAFFVFCVLLNASPFGKDNRVEQRSREYPFNTIGKFGGCTGTLIGPDLVLTAAHCVIDSTTQKLDTNIHTFSLNVIDGKPLATSKIRFVWWGTKLTRLERKKDWAILLLEKKLGDEFGFLELSGEVHRQVTLIGYSSDFKSRKTAGIQKNCFILDDETPGLLLHNCDTAPGASGAALLSNDFDGTYKIVGLHSAHQKDESSQFLGTPLFSKTNYNTAISSSNFLDTVELLKATGRCAADGAEIKN